MTIEKYVLITAAKNEERHISNTIEAILAQTILPTQWIIVSDGSIDHTDEIALQYAGKCNFIKLIHKKETDTQCNFASKVYAICIGYNQLKDIDYQFIGHLDADISFKDDYYENVLERFRNNSRLGIAGGFIYEKRNNRFESRPFNSIESVAGAIQLFRRECYEAIGGLIPLKAGGEDWYAEVMARINGWEVVAFPELKVYHHKTGIKVRGILKEGFRMGIMDYSLGIHPLLELTRCANRTRQKPFLLLGLTRLFGFLWSYYRRDKLLVSDDFIKYLRKEQTATLKRIIKSAFG